jgi:hypothetical protein
VGGLDFETGLCVSYKHGYVDADRYLENNSQAEKEIEEMANNLF